MLRFRRAPAGGSRPSGNNLVVDLSSKPLADLLRVAAAAARSGARVSFTGADRRSVEDLVRLAAAGGDRVTFLTGADHRANEALAEPAPRHSDERPAGRWNPFAPRAAAG